MADSDSPPVVAGRWPHRFAVLMACATAVMLWLGAIVTSMQAGMAVPDWPSTYGYNVFLYPWQTWIFGPADLFVEHGHRLFGALLGAITIAMTVSVWMSESRRWVKNLSLCALALVIAQGVLGGVRVLLDDRMFAMLHGCTGPLFFVVAVTIATVTSRWWRTAGAPRTDVGAGRLHGLAISTAAIAYVQLVLGAMVRHAPDGTTPDQFRMMVLFHLAMAAVVTIHILLLAARIGRRYRSERRLWWPALGLVGLLVAQLALGSATWITHYGVPRWIADNAWTASFTVQAGSPAQIQVTTAHVIDGSLILATAVAIALRSFRILKAEPTARVALSRLAEVTT